MDLADSGPGQGKRALQRQMLQDYAKDVKALLTSEGVTLASITRFLQNRPGFLDAAEAYNVPRAGRFVNFLKLYPQFFRIAGSGSGIKVLPATNPEPRAEAASGSRDVPSLGPRIARSQSIPNDQIVDFASQNPHRPGTEAFRRYEIYAESSTIGQARRLGMTPSDLRQLLRTGAIQLR